MLIALQHVGRGMRDEIRFAPQGVKAVYYYDVPLLRGYCDVRCRRTRVKPSRRTEAV